MNKNDSKRTRTQKGLIDPGQVKVFPVKKETELLLFLLEKMPNESRNTVKRILANQQVSVGGAPVTQFNFKLYPEDEVIVSKRRIQKHSRSDLPILYEDDDIIVINKPSRLLSIASDREKGKTAYRMVSDYIAQKDPKGRIFVIHRLDEDTSGVLMFAKRYDVKEAYQKSWQEIVQKRGYYAIVEGQMEKPKDTFKDYLEQNSLNLVYVSQNKVKGKLSITSYEVMKEKGGYSLLDVNIDSGRKNQIRVQLGHRGHYVIGDDKYGEPSNPLGRLGLHAYELALTNPLTGKKMKFTAPIPSSFKEMFYGKGIKEPAEKKPQTVRSYKRESQAVTKMKKANQNKNYFGKGGRRHG